MGLLEAYELPVHVRFGVQGLLRESQGLAAMALKKQVLEFL